MRFVSRSLAAAGSCSALLEQVTLEPNPTATETVTSFTTSANGGPGAPSVASFSCGR
jgi:hypothetical protein